MVCRGWIFSVHDMKGLNHDEVCKQLVALGSQMALFYHVSICPKCRCVVCLPLVESSSEDFVSVYNVVFTENCPDGQNTTNCL